MVARGKENRGMLKTGEGGWEIRNSSYGMRPAHEDERHSTGSINGVIRAVYGDR